MGSVPRPLVLLHADPRFRTQVQEAVRGDFALRRVESWSALNEAVEGWERRGVVVADPYWGTGGDHLAPELRTLMEQFPSVPVLAVVEVVFERFKDIRLLLEWGAVEIIGERHHDVGGIAALLRSARRRPAESLLQRVLPSSVTPRAMPILVAIADVAEEGGKATEVAKVLHVSIRTLLRWCEAARLPPPRQLLAWFRILRAAEMLDIGAASIEQVAIRCGYASDSGLRRALQDFLQLGPRELQQAGALETATAAFRHAVEAQERSPMERTCRRIPGVLRSR
jgi:AraC-like DNA-binding protein